MEIQPLDSIFHSTPGARQWVLAPLCPSPASPAALELPQDTGKALSWTGLVTLATHPMNIPSPSFLPWLLILLLLPEARVFVSSQGTAGHGPFSQL